MLGDIEIVAGLKINPELRRHAKVVTKLISRRSNFSRLMVMLLPPQW